MPPPLWTTYFTSSKEIKELLEKEGRDAFLAEIRRTFPTGEEAMRWEANFLKRIGAAQNPNWFNKHNGGKGFHLLGPRSEKHKAALRKNHVSWNRGGTHSGETREKMRCAHAQGRNGVRNITDNYVKPFLWRITGNGIDVLEESLIAFAQREGLKKTVYDAAAAGRPYRGFTFERVPR